jgi:hypothetical protein
MTTKKEEKAAEKAEAISTLKRMGVKPGAEVFTIVTHVSSSGMTRHIRCFIPTTNTSTDYKTGKKTRKPGITDITGLVSTVCGYTRAKGSRWDLVVQGCGMDMCFSVVYNLGRVMFPKGGPLDKSSPGRKHQEEREAKTNGRPVEGETDGGYLLQKRDL